MIASKNVCLIFWLVEKFIGQIKKRKFNFQMALTFFNKWKRFYREFKWRI